jgi:hypothetical protein
METLDLTLSDNEEPITAKVEVKPDVPAPTLSATAPSSSSTSSSQAIDTILAIIPDIHPSYVRNLLLDKTTKSLDNIVEQLLTSDYPLANGRYKNGGVRAMYVPGSGGDLRDCMSCDDKVKPLSVGSCFSFLSSRLSLTAL